MDERDIADLAALHISCLSDSAVAVLGPRYARSFYRYVTSSGREIAFVERNGARRIVAAAVISLEPATLNRRLLLHTSLLVSLLRHPRHTLALLSGHREDHAPPPDAANALPLPEMILIYTSSEERGRGRGTALIEQAERRLRQLGVAAYQVKTVASASNPALAFYRNRNFTPSGTSFTLGRQFQVFTRRLDPERHAS